MHWKGHCDLRPQLFDLEVTWLTIPQGALGPNAALLGLANLRSFNHLLLPPIFQTKKIIFNKLYVISKQTLLSGRLSSARTCAKQGEAELMGSRWSTSHEGKTERRLSSMPSVWAWHGFPGVNHWENLRTIVWVTEVIKSGAFFLPSAYNHCHFGGGLEEVEAKCWHWVCLALPSDQAMNTRWR